jgi:hypothetical protein
MQNRGRYERIALELVTSGLNTRGTAMRLKTARKLAAMLLVAMAICVSAATPAYADGTDAATGFACTIAYSFDPSYYADYCEQSSST